MKCNDGVPRRRRTPARRPSKPRVTLETANVSFRDEPQDETTARAIVWRCFADHSLAFEIVDGPRAEASARCGFRLLKRDSIAIPAPGSDPGAKARLWLTYRGEAPGTTARGHVRVRCRETGEQWDVALEANTVARPSSAVVVVLGRSSSMRRDAGDGRPCIDALREAMYDVIELLAPHHAVGIVRFDHEAQLALPLTALGAELLGAPNATRPCRWR